MPRFGKTSKSHLDTLCPELQEVLIEAIKHVDFSITCGHRGEIEQNQAYDSGHSEVRWPNSKHNSLPSHAADLAPYINGIKWDDVEGFTLLAGIIKGIGIMMGYDIRVGVDWDGDLFVKEHSFIDRPHVEYRGRL